MKILVTGSSGRVGSAIAEHLAVSHQIIGVDRVYGEHTSHQCDLLSSQLTSIAGSVDAIIHCAALHAPHINQYPEQAFWDNNVQTTKALIEASSPSTTFILTSTTSVFGDAMNSVGKTKWIDETVGPQPRDIYDITKLAAEDIVRKACANGRVGTVLRISRCFPEAENLMALYRLYRGVDLRDVSKAHELALTASDGGFSSYVISGPTKFRKSDIATLSSNAWKCVQDYYPEAAHIFVQREWDRPKSIGRIYCSDRARAELGYQPKYGIDEFLNGDRRPNPQTL